MPGVMTSTPRFFLPLAFKAAATHTITYMLMGVLASTLLDYKAVFARPDMACWMRPLDDPMIMFGPLMQPLRGLVFALVLYPFRELLFARDRGWLVLWALLVGLGIVNTYGPTPGSLEGMLYTVIPVPDQLKGYLEVVPQAGLFSFLLVHWVRHPEKRWLARTLTVLFAIAIALPLLGLLAGGRG
jgi:hypothetical protein